MTSVQAVELFGYCIGGIMVIIILTGIILYVHNSIEKYVNSIFYPRNRNRKKRKK